MGRTQSDSSVQSRLGAGPAAHWAVGRGSQAAMALGPGERNSRAMHSSSRNTRMNFPISVLLSVRRSFVNLCQSNYTGSPPPSTIRRLNKSAPPFSVKLHKGTRYGKIAKDFPPKTAHFVQPGENFLQKVSISGKRGGEMTYSDKTRNTPGEAKSPGAPYSSISPKRPVPPPLSGRSPGGGADRRWGSPGP